MPWACAVCCPSTLSNMLTDSCCDDRPRIRSMIFNRSYTRTSQSVIFGWWKPTLYSSPGPGRQNEGTEGDGDMERALRFLPHHRHSPGLLAPHRASRQNAEGERAKF